MCVPGSGVVYWALDTMGCDLLNTIWTQIAVSHAERRSGQSEPRHIARVVHDAVKAEVVEYYDKDKDGIVTTGEVSRLCLQGLALASIQPAGVIGRANVLAPHLCDRLLSSQCASCWAQWKAFSNGRYAEHLLHSLCTFWCTQ